MIRYTELMGPETGVRRSRGTGQFRRSPADLIHLQAVSAALIQLAASEAEGQVVWTCVSQPVTGGQLVSFLVSYMFVYLRLSPFTTGL